MKIADAHTHIFPDKIAEKASDAIGKFYDIPMYQPAQAQRLVAAEAEIGAGRCLVCSSATIPEQVESINTFIAEACRQNPLFLGLAAMHPDYQNVGEELDRAMELGLKGVKFHPDFQKFDIDDPRAIPMYKAIAARGLPVLFHTGDDRYDFSSPFRVDALLRQVPDLIVIGAHFGGYRRWDDVITLPRRENVYFDTSSSLMFIDREQALRLMDHFGIDRFMFGSDFPMWRPKKELERFLALGLSDAENEQILHGTFESLFGAFD